MRANAREAERERRVPGREPADDRVALADLSPQLGRARPEALLEVVDDLVALLERIAIDARERVPAAVYVEDAGHWPSILPGCLAGPLRCPRLPTVTPSLVTPLASVTDFIVDPIVEAATDFIDSVGLIGVFILMLLESACIPVPSEAIMLFAGFNVSEGDLTMFGIIAAGVLGNVVGSWIAWAAGYYGRMELLEKNRLIHINPKHLAWADDWFQRHGDATVFFTRMLPIIRTFISLPAGVAKMPFWRFTWLTLAGCIPWVTHARASSGARSATTGRSGATTSTTSTTPSPPRSSPAIVYFLIKRRRGSGPPPAPADSAA